MKRTIINIGTVVGSTSPQEFKFNLKSFGAKLGDLVNVEIYPLRPRCPLGNRFQGRFSRANETSGSWPEAMAHRLY